MFFVLAERCRRTGRTKRKTKRKQNEQHRLGRALCESVRIATLRASLRRAAAAHTWASVPVRGSRRAPGPPAMPTPPSLLLGWGHWIRNALLRGQTLEDSLSDEGGGGTHGRSTIGVPLASRPWVPYPRLPYSMPPPYASRPPQTPRYLWGGMQQYSLFCPCRCSTPRHDCYHRTVQGTQCPGDSSEQHNSTIFTVRYRT